MLTVLHGRTTFLFNVKEKSGLVSYDAQIRNNHAHELFWFTRGIVHLRGGMFIIA